MAYTKLQNKITMETINSYSILIMSHNRFHLDEMELNTKLRERLDGGNFMLRLLPGITEIGH
jgi:hypothetical protein